MRKPTPCWTSRLQNREKFTLSKPQPVARGHCSQADQDCALLGGDSEQPRRTAGWSHSPPGVPRRRGVIPLRLQVGSVVETAACGGPGPALLPGWHAQEDSRRASAG